MVIVCMNTLILYMIKMSLKIFNVKTLIKVRQSYNIGDIVAFSIKSVIICVMIKNISLYEERVFMEELSLKSGRSVLSDRRIQKMKHIFYGFLICVFIIVLRLFYLQIESCAFLRRMGEHNFLRTEVVPPLRGNFLDCNNVLLAANRPVFDLYWQGKGSSLLQPYHYELLRKVGFIAGSDLLRPEVIQSVHYAEQNMRRTLLARDISFEALCQMSEQCPYVSNIFVENRFKRVYPFKSFASHVLGYLNRIENCGKSGLELLFENQLQGESGHITRITNSRGKSLSCKEFKHAKAGDNIQLTIDFQIQQLAETLLDPGQVGCVVVSDAETGAIRAMASFPSFDPNFFLGTITQQRWKEEMIANNPMLNRVCSAEYPPASVFKIVTFAAGLEEDLMQESSEVVCKGYVNFCGRNYYCIRHSGHGKLCMKDAFAKSCNIQCFEIAKKIKIDKLADYAACFGLGQKTNFLLPEKRGLVPTSSWKKENKGESWWRGETLSASIGQSYLLATPLQISRLVNSICTGYLVKPRLLETEPIEREKLRLAESTRTFLRESMKEAVNSGTGWRLRSLKNFDTYVKTGTAQTCGLLKEITSARQLEHAWLISFFSYKGGRPLSLVILIENVGSSLPAIVATKKFLQGYERIIEMQKSV